MLARIYGHRCYYVYVPTLEGVKLSPPPKDTFNDQSEYLQQ